MISTKDIAWVAGLLEGEGSFLTATKKPRSIRIQMCMTDEDVVRRAADILNAGVTGPYTSKQLLKSGSTRKPFWTLNVHGRHAAAWMMTIYTLMGQRRKQRIEEILSTWKTLRGTGRKAECHPSEKHYAKGKCYKCYYTERDKLRA